MGLLKKRDIPQTLQDVTKKTSYKNSLESQNLRWIALTRLRRPNGFARLDVHLDRWL